VIDLSVGAAGAGVIFLYAHRQGLDDRALGWAQQTAERLLEVAESTPDGPRWPMMADMPFAFTAPNFAHGGAGVGYFLADLYKDTANKEYLDTAIAAARYVQSRAVASGKGCLVCHNEEQQPPTLFYLSVCHGPAGTGRLMFLLNEITEDPAWLDWVHDNMQGLLATGAPETRSAGLWQNLGQCCGDAGIGDYALSLFRTTGKKLYLDLAQRIANYAITQSEFVDGGRFWQQAEHRNRPDFLESQTGYMQGAAGLGSFLLHLATVEGRNPSKITLPETPFS
jgi:lantibiotic modifying enzyme